MQKYYLGIDLGGSKILAGLFDEELNLVGRNKMRTKPERGFASVVERIARCATDLVDDFDIEKKSIVSLGIGTPGSIDVNGNVIFAGNLDWENVPLKKQLEKVMQIPVSVENDCNVATLGIYHHELKAKPVNMVGIFLGTGVGAGLILNRQLYRGTNLIAGEIGHTVLDVNGEQCNCGNRGCFELFASRSSIFRKIGEAIKNGEETQLADKKLENLRSGDLEKAIRRGDKCVARLVDEAAHYTGIAVANVVNLLNPDVVVLGGGVIDALEDQMMPVIDKVAHEYAFPGIPPTFQVVATKLGDNAGITGAAVLAKGI